MVDNEMFEMNNIKSEDFFMPGYKTTDEYGVFYQFEEQRGNFSYVNNRKTEDLKVEASHTPRRLSNYMDGDVTNFTRYKDHRWLSRP